MLSHQTALRLLQASQPNASDTITTNSTISSGSLSRSASWLQSGMGKLNALEKAFKRHVAALKKPSTQSVDDSSSSANAEAEERRAAENDKLLVDSELTRYINAGIVSGDKLNEEDILGFWQIM